MKSVEGQGIRFGLHSDVKDRRRIAVISKGIALLRAELFCNGTVLFCTGIVQKRSDSFALLWSSIASQRMSKASCGRVREKWGVTWLCYGKVRRGCVKLRKREVIPGLGK